MEEEALRIDNDVSIQSDYGAFDELHSCSSKDIEELVLVRPKYSEFNKDIDIKKNPILRSA